MTIDCQNVTVARTSRVGLYFERNGRWLMPLLIASVALLGSQLGAALLIEPGQPTPTAIALAARVLELLAEGGSIIAMIAAGTFARLCDTISAKVFSLVLMGGSLAALALLAWKHFGH